MVDVPWAVETLDNWLTWTPVKEESAGVLVVLWMFANYSSVFDVINKMVSTPPPPHPWVIIPQCYGMALWLIARVSDA